VHADDDALWAFALGEDVPLAGPSSAAEHVRGCSACSRALAGRRRVVDTGRRPPPADLALRPPPRVLEAVRAELGAPDGRPAPSPGAAVAGPPVPGGGSREGVGGRRRGGGGRRRTAVLAALVGAVVGLGAGAGLAGRLDGQQPGAAVAPAEVLARAVLEPLGEDGARGAAVLRDAGGSQVLEVDVDGAGAPAGSYQEVWLLDGSSGEMVSLGALADGHGVFTVPAGVVAGTGAVQVDVSDEPLDGQPAHSGASLARGPLEG